CSPPRNAGATTTSVGRYKVFPLSVNHSRVSFAVSTRFGSYRDFPTECPCATRKVLAIAPPTITESAKVPTLLIALILVETFDPPKIATRGRAGERHERLK